MTIGMAPLGKLICPWQPAGDEHEIVWVAAAFDDDGTEEYFRCNTCPRALRVRGGIIESEALVDGLVVIKMTARKELPLCKRRRRTRHSYSPARR
jgi:hypothetical protein